MKFWALKCRKVQTVGVCGILSPSPDRPGSRISEVKERGERSLVAIMRLMRNVGAQDELKVMLCRGVQSSLLYGTHQCIACQL